MFKSIWAIFLILLSCGNAHAIPLICDTLKLDLNSDTPVQGEIVKIKVYENEIVLLDQLGLEKIYNIDYRASRLDENHYVAKLGYLPIEETPTYQQISLIIIKESATSKQTEGLLTDSKLENYVLRNCKELNR